jgi:hypothetical protein
MGRREEPVPDGPLRDFAQDLRRLRRDADVTYRALAVRARYSPSVLSAAAAGDVLPTLPVTLAYVAACGGEQAVWQTRWEQLAGVLRATHPGLLPPEALPGAAPVRAEPAEAAQHSDLARALEAIARQREDLDAVARADEPSLAEQSTLPGEAAPAVEPAVHAPGASTAGSGTGARIGPLGKQDPRRIGPFRLVGRLGGGAMGEVFLAVGPGQRPAALKLIRAELARDPLFRRRFAAELAAARKVAGVRCPAVVDADAEAQRPWMATEFVPAPPLHEIVERCGPLPEPAVFALAAGIAEALEAIHGAGIVHRDLKPSNVLWDGEGPKVIDFGVCRAADGTALTTTGSPVGTAGYTAPEQAEHGDARAAGDVFALGCVLAYAATGIAAFGEGTGHEILYRIIHQDPLPESVACRDERLRDLVLACLHKDPALRPNPAQVIEACEDAAAPDVPTPVAGMVAERGRCVARAVSRARMVRRARLGVAALGTAAAVALIPVLLLRGSGAPLHPNAAAPKTGTPGRAGSSQPAAGPGQGADSPSPVRPTASSTAATGGGAISPGAGSSGGPSGSSPGPPAVPSTQGGIGIQAAAPTAFSGPACASPSTTASLSLYTAPDGDGWHSVGDASAPNGCGTPMYTALSGKTDGQWQDDGDWVFHPGAGATCTAQVHIPDSSKAAATAHYWIYDEDGTKGTTGNKLLRDHPVDQSANRGAWVSLGTVTTSTGTLDVSIVDNGAGSADIAADNAELFCS